MWINKSDSAPIWGCLLLYNHHTYHHRRSQTVCNQAELSTSWTPFGDSVTQKGTYAVAPNVSNWVNFKCRKISKTMQHNSNRFFTIYAFLERQCLLRSYNVSQSVKVTICPLDNWKMARSHIANEKMLLTLPWLPLKKHDRRLCDSL